MPVLVQCPECREEFRVSEADLGRPGRCRKCGREISLLATRDSDAPPAGDTRPPWSPPRPAELAAGETFGRYRILRRLGRGGMATVYLAHDSELERDVALKIPRFAADESPEVVRRFTREAKALAKLDHPNICPVFDVGQVDGVPFLTMPYVEGQPLSALVTEPPLPQRKAAEVVRTLARALAEAHARGVIHRDLKPLNVLIGPRRKLVIMDFGLARRVEATDSRITQAGSILGTPAYMAPEQIRGDIAAIGQACDIYALGVILYELLAGRLPFEGPASVVMGLVMVMEPPRPSEFRPDLDPNLEAICRRAMAKAIPDRYPSMTALAEALDDYLRASAPAGRPSQASGVPPERAPEVPAPVPLPEKAAGHRPPARRLGLIAIAAAVLGLLGIVIWIANDTGTVRIEVQDPTVVVRVDGQEIQIDATGQTLTLRAGPHHLLVTHNDLVVETRKFEVRRNDRQVLEVSYRPKPPPPPPPPVVQPEPSIPPPAPEPAVAKADRETAPKPDVPEPAPSAIAKTDRASTPKPAVSKPAPPPSRETTPPPARDLKNSIGMTLVLIDPGEFAMGSPDSDAEADTDEKPQHPVRISTPFYLGRCEVTQDQYRQVMGANPSSFKGEGSLPVETVSWFDAVAFCNTLSEQEKLAPYYKVAGQEVTILGGDGYRLPTEAEWEYACRAGSKTRYGFGDDAARLGEYAWYDDNSKVGGSWQTHPVGQKKPNAWDLHDMHGNVWEWCWDWYDETYYKQMLNKDPTGPGTGTARVLRGGSYNGSAAYLRSASRGRNGPADRNLVGGFRPARTYR